ncbi:MAG: anti-sigma factor domain-containing protein [Gaiellaceae bacterium]
MERAEIHELSAPYALDALDPAEREAFEQHLARCAECREAVAGFQDVAAELAYDADAPPPPPALRERILTEARRDGANVVALPRRRWLVPVTATAAVAAGVAALALSFWAADLSQELDDERAALHLSEEAVSVLAEPDARRIPLDGADGMLVVDESGEGWLVLRGLESAPAEQTYEAWVIEGEEAAPAGLFAGGGVSTVVPLTIPVPEGAVVAVTVERAGGVDQPTQDPVFASEDSV